MKRLIVRMGVTILALVAAIQLIRPQRDNPATVAGRAIENHVPMTLRAHAVFERACRDCHTSRTRWPWYSHVAPASWIVAEHVNHARSHLNVSEWGAYATPDARARLEGMCKLAREGSMPLPSYLWLHRDARLSGQDVEDLCAWTRAAIESLQNAPASR
ncbi:MAG TPA: heme-binding domain-containing protein [Candidatus Polarisedimenticolia bacterium]|nr:heme-binding domain-containing protein [Candidatus Polarisedimenticolia bacterium]